MRARIRVWIAGVMSGCLFNVVLAASAVGQQSEEKPVQPELPAPVVAPGTAPPQPPKSATLTLEDRADIFMARKSYADAVDYYRRALATTGRSDANLWNKLGIAYQQLTDLSAARKAYKEATRHQPNFAQAWNNMGTTYYLSNKARKSLKYYRQAIKVNPYNGSFHLNLGTSYYRLKRIKEAMEEYRVALSLDPNVLTDRSMVGTVLQAREADAKFFFYMAKVFASVGRAEEAVRYLRRALEDGFNDLKLLDEDPDLQKINQFPAYVELRKNPPKAIRD